MKNVRLVAYCLFFLCFSKLNAQNLPFYYSANNIEVQNENGRELQFPFAGGLKHPLFGMLDLNNDGNNDLIVLDRIDNRILTYRNIGIKDSFGFLYRSQYEMLIPDSIAKTFLFKDYNNDERPDLFAFANTKGVGIQVYKNISSSSQIIFELVANPIKASSYGYPESDIYVSSDDLPAIEDIDGDGDLDILTFSIIQGYVEYYKNQSQELYQNTDSLKYILADDCWGKFMEGDATNHISLNIVPTYCYVIDHINHILKKRVDTRLLIPDRHAGSTLLANDMDNDGDVDIVLGDVQYPGLILLKNGKNDYSHIRDSIISYDTNFPKNTKPVHVRQMPGMFYLDLDNDSIKDMVVSPMDVNLADTIDGLNQVWLYKNLGTNYDPKFNFMKNDFLQEEMIDLGGATQPVFFDYDNDGDHDLFVVTTGNYPETQHNHDRIVLFENTGSSVKAQFRFKNDDYSGFLSKNYQSLTLAFGDIDADKKTDMILGKKDGTISFYKNISIGNDTARFQFVTDFLNNIDVGYFSAPFVYDMNADNYGELFIGHDQGEISYFLNTGANYIPAFQLMTSSFGGITFSSLNHFTTPVITDLNNNGKPELVFTHNYWDGRYGIVIGDIGFVEDIDGDTSKRYKPVYDRIKDPYSQKIVTRHPGKLLRPAFANLDGDGKPDLMLGSSRGGLMLLTTLSDTLSIAIDELLKNKSSSIAVYPNPAHAILNIGLIDYKGNFMLELTDLSGKTILNTNFRGGAQVQLDINSIPAGFYIIRLHDLGLDHIYFKKIIIY